MKTLIKTSFLLLALTSVFSVMQSLGQGTLTITFNGPPVQPVGTAQLIQEYVESDMTFTPILADDRFIQNGGGIPGQPDNGTTYLQGGGESLKCLFIGGFLFNLISVDLAGYSTVVPDAMVLFIGYLQDNSTVTTTFSVSGIGFQTLYFGQEFSNLLRLEISTEDAWSLDNLVVTQIPEPVTGMLLVAGGFLLWMGRRRR